MQILPSRPPDGNVVANHALVKSHLGGRVAGYSGTSLPSMLGLKEGFAVALLGAPPDSAAA